MRKGQKEATHIKHILVIDDDVHIGNMLQEVLESEGYRVSRAYSGTEALLALNATRPDLILLDLMLPGLSGEKLLPKIKDIPVIVVSAKADATGKVDLLLGGAVDYVTKPFHMKELLARIAVQFRVSQSQDAAVFTYGAIEMRPAENSVTVSGAPVKLTRTEYAVLKQLLQNQRQVVTKSAMLERISVDTPDCTEASLKIHVSNLRKKLREISGEDYIESVWGIGFKLQNG